MSKTDRRHTDLRPAGVTPCRFAAVRHAAGHAVEVGAGSRATGGVRLSTRRACLPPAMMGSGTTHPSSKEPPVVKKLIVVALVAVGIAIAVKVAKSR